MYKGITGSQILNKQVIRGTESLVTLYNLDVSLFSIIQAMVCLEGRKTMWSFQQKENEIYFA